MPGFWEILIILLVVFFVFGAKRLPEIARSVGKGIQEFKRSQNDSDDDSNNNQTNVKKDGNELGNSGNSTNKAS